MMNYLSLFVTLVVMLVFMPKLIEYLTKLKFGQTEREEGLGSHKVKNGTPTMGGIGFVLIPTLIAVLFNYRLLLNSLTQIVIISFIGYAVIGFVDDYKIVVQKDNAGLSAKSKFLMQAILAVVIFSIYYFNVGNTDLMIPLIHTKIALPPILFFLLVFIMFTAESNAVNLTDGLDGLCAGVSIIALIPFIVLACVNKKLDLAILIANIVAGLVIYLKFNKHPAKVFMGDTGSLALGGLFASIALVEQQEIVLLVVGAIFIVETLSVIIQVTYFRKTGKRIFKMAPIHHHFEAKGMSEVKVVKIFYIAAIICATLGLILGVL